MPPNWAINAVIPISGVVLHACASKVVEIRQIAFRLVFVREGEVQQAKGRPSQKGQRRNVNVPPKKNGFFPAVRPASVVRLTIRPRVNKACNAIREHR